MNDTQITFSGWVGSDVTLTDIGNGTQVASFRVGSTPRRLRNGVWEDGPTAWYTVKAWRALGEHAHASLHNGDPVVVHGRLIADVWRRDDGSVSTKFVVVATSVGHDLARGTSVFTKAARRGTASSPDESVAQAVIHAYDDAGPRLDSDGQVVPDPAPLEAEQDPARVEPAA